MVRLFKHYIPHAVLLLGLFDLVLLAGAAEFAWRLRADQLGLDFGHINDRAGMLGAFTGVMLTAMISIGVYGAESLRSLRYAGARLAGTRWSGRSARSCCRSRRSNFSSRSRS